MLSVLIPAYKNDDTLLRLLESLSKQSIASQIEIIVSDDGSVPALGQGPQFQEIRNRLNIQWHYQSKNLGVLGNGQFLAKAAKNQFAVFAQHDDYYIDNYFFERSLGLIKDNPNLGFIFGNAAFEDSGKSLMVGGTGIQICSGIAFAKLFWNKLMTSWSSVIFDNEALKKYGGFGIDYTISANQGHLFSAYPQEEGMGFLYLLAIEKDCALDWNAVSVRGLPESRFSISPDHPVRALKNDSMVFIYWNVALICEKYGDRGRAIARRVRLVATRFGLHSLNSDIKIFFGHAWRTRFFLMGALFMNRIGRIRHQKNVARGKIKRYTLLALNKLNLH